MPSLFAHYADSGCSWHRLLQPIRFCGPDYAGHDLTLDMGEGLRPGYDWFAFHGLMNPVAVVEAAKLRRRGSRFLWSLDDDWLTIPDWNPAKPDENGLAMYDLTKALADLVVVSTPGVAASLSDIAEKVVVAPNLLDVAAFPAAPPVEYNAAGEPTMTFVPEFPVRVVWSGGPTHLGDIGVLEDVADRVLRRLGPGKVAFVFVGMPPPPKLLANHLNRGVMHQPPVPFVQYQRIINTVQPAVWLAPLAEIPFNLAKSNLRVIEGWALCAPSVATPWGEYTCVAHGVDGLLASSPGEWVEAICRLVEDDALRMSLAANGRYRVEQEYDWNRWECRRPWHGLFSRMFELPLPEGPR